ncbi:MAG: ATP-dependent RNA helicase [Deltaproteobacteria bacterium]|nr:ATP-dependent RNA helicase [Deltaproteobacteria bacterium]
MAGPRRGGGGGRGPRRGGGGGRGGAGERSGPPGGERGGGGWRPDDRPDGGGRGRDGGRSQGRSGRPGTPRQPPPPRPPPPPAPTPKTTAELQASARSLPIYEHEALIIDTIRRHRVVVVEGPTGSGKTTQLPRMLLHTDFTEHGQIGVTQPRRIAAVSVSWRIAAEEGTTLGQEVGYAIRFDDITSPQTRIKVMTDGLLLQEVRSDPLFSAYSVIMVDEAHERTLNIDFTLGLLHRALQRRDDLHVIVSSATIAPETFQEFFADVAGEVPLLSIGARTFPVKLTHRPPVSDHPGDTEEAFAEEVLRIHRSGEPGHILGFLTGEGMIHGVEDAILRRHPGRDLLLLPLYGRLTREEQERVFFEFPGQRKVVLATNIAETSITIPDVRFVIDTGLAKVPRVSSRTGITTLLEEGISQASAAQRAGRAGRTAPGEAIRLYDARELERRPLYTDEEIRRLDLADVALRLIDHGVRDLEAFPFPTPPPQKKLEAALAKLRLMGAIDRERGLTRIGERMVHFPLEPALSRMIVEAADRFPKVVDEVLVVCAFLSGRPPYLFPAGEEVEARDGHRALHHPLGDAVTAVEAWNRWRQARDPEAFCKRHYLDPHAMAFIDKTHTQLVDIAQRMGIEVDHGGDVSGIVRSLAAGYADRILVSREGRGYEGPGDDRIHIHPSSALFGDRHRYVVATEIVEARRTYARQVSALRPEWIADLDPDVARSVGIRPKKSRDAGGAVDPATLPVSITLGSVTLPVTLVRGEPRIDVPVEAIGELIGAPTDALPARALTWRARISNRYHHFLPGTPLGTLLALLPYLPLPGPDERLQRESIEGVLLEADRNLHGIALHLDRLLAPMLPERGKRPGWLALVANGGGGYWYEVMGDFPDALETTVSALEDLAETIPAADPLEARIDALAAGLDEPRQAIEQVLAAGRAGRKGR